MVNVELFKIRKDYNMKKSIAILLVITMTFGLAGCSAKAESNSEAYVMSTENFGITESELNYLYELVYNQYASYLSMFGVDPNVSLKEQEFSEGVSWYDNFMEEAKLYASDLLLFNEEALANGISLDDSDLNSVRSEIEEINNQATANGFKNGDEYFKSLTGADVTLAAHEAFMKKSILASKMYSALSASFEFSESDILNYYSENENKFLKIDFLSYIVDSTADAGVSSNLLGSTSANEFINAAKEASGDLTSEEITFVGIAYQDSAFFNWAFDPQTKVGETFSYVDDGGMNTIYYLTAKPYKNETRMVNVRHILITESTFGSDEAAKAEAERILDAWTNGEATAMSFAALAAEHTEDPGSQSTGGLYTDITPGYMVPTFDAWIFDSSRAVGDTGIVKTDFGYHVMYFDSFGDAIWQTQAKEIMISEAFNAAYEAMKAKYTINFAD